MNSSSLRGRRWLRTIVTTAALVAGRSTLMHAQTCQATNVAPGTSANPQCSVQVASTVTVPHLLQLTTSATTSTLLAPGIAQYDSSATAVSTNNATANPWAMDPASPFTVSVKGNRAWQLQISALAANWTFTAQAPYNVARTGSKPASDFYWSTAQAGPFTALSTTGTQIATNPTGSSISYNIYYKVKWLYASDVPGKYDLTIVYTLIGQ